MQHALCNVNAIPMFNLVEYSDDYPKTSGSLWQYHRGDPVLDNNDNIVNFSGKNVSFKFKIKITGKTPAAGDT